MCSHSDRPQDSLLAGKRGIYERQHEEDLRASVVTAHFPFFRLPLDIRKMVYEELFKTPFLEKIITPDPSHRRRQLGRRYAKHTVKYDLALLQTCQQACDEATSTLYGSKVFYFSDASYAYESIMVEATAYCWYCPVKGGYSGCSDAHDGKHYVEIPHCDFVGMHDWLLKIGENNRLKIRNIHISLAGPQFSKVLGEHHLVQDPLKPSPVGGDLIEKALLLLARGHNLNTIGIFFERRYLDLLDPWEEARLINSWAPWAPETNAASIWTAFERIFSNGLNHRLKNALSIIKGIETLVCDLASVTPQPSGSWTDEGAHALKGFREVKECMEAGYANRKMVETSEPRYSKPYVDQSINTKRDRKSFATISSGDRALEGSPEPTNPAENASLARQCRPFTLESPLPAADFLLFKES